VHARFPLPPQRKADVISSALFGDGAPVAVLRAEHSDASLRIGASADHTWPGALDIMGRTINPIGFDVVLSRSLPGFVEQQWLTAPACRL
jgi:alkylresorcinol/alkylpyrone synthase